MDPLLRRLMVAAIISLAATTHAYAQSDPPGCTGSGVGLAVTPLVVPPPPDAPYAPPYNIVLPGQVVRYVMAVSQPQPGACNYFGGQLSVRLPDGQRIELAGFDETPDVPVIGFDTPGPFTIEVPTLYTVDAADANGAGQLIVRVDYGPTTFAPDQAPGTVLSLPPTPANSATLAYPLTLAVLELQCPEDMLVGCPHDVPDAADDLPQFVAEGGMTFGNCPGEIVIEHAGDASDGNTCPEVITRTYRAIDTCGLVVECAQLITVHDMIDPEVRCPVGHGLRGGLGAGVDGDLIELQCQEPVQIAIDESDNCHGEVELSFKVITRPRNAVQITPRGDGVFDLVMHETAYGVVTYTATDACGNRSSCAFAVAGACPDCCDPGEPNDGVEGPCDEPHADPCCRIERCCEAVCHGPKPMPFCCQVQWDQACVDLALEVCIPEVECPGEGDCYQANGTPGCDDISCCDLICSVSFYCCLVVWDASCAEQAEIACGLDGGGNKKEPKLALAGMDGGRWSNDRQWSTGVVPGTGTDAAVFGPTLVDERAAVAGLQIADGGSMHVSDALLVAASIDVAPAAMLAIDDAGHVVTLSAMIDGTLVVPVTSRAAIDIGTARLGGSLIVEAPRGWRARRGTSIEILRAAKLRGRFESSELPLLPDGLRWEVVYGPERVEAIVR